MNILENEFENMLEQMINDGSEHIKDLQLKKGYLLRQPALHGYGKMDLVLFNYNTYFLNGTVNRVKQRDLLVTCIELKKDKIGYNELGQLCRYMQGIERVAQNDLSNLNITVRGILIGRDIEHGGDFAYLADKVAVSDIDIYSYVFDYKTGLRFEHQNHGGWHSVSEDFGNIPGKEIIINSMRVKY